MNTDIRISVSFKGHRKRAKLRRLLGDRSTDYLIDLWLSVAMDRPDGNLEGLDATDIAIMAGWESDPMVLVNALVEVGFLDLTTVERPLNDVTTTRYSLHDWCDHNAYASSANDRSDKSRFSRMAHTNPQLYEELRQNGYDSISSEEYKRLTSANDRLTTVERPLTNRLSPSPSPSPSIEDKPIGLKVPYEEIWLAFNKFCPSLPKARDVNSLRHSRIRALWLRYDSNPGGALHFFDTLFKKAEASDFLSGRNGKWKGCCLDWLLDDANVSKVIEGNYDEREAPKHSGKTSTGMTREEEIADLRSKGLI